MCRCSETTDLSIEEIYNQVLQFVHVTLWSQGQCLMKEGVGDKLVTQLMFSSDVLARLLLYLSNTVPDFVNFLSHARIAKCGYT